MPPLQIGGAWRRLLRIGGIVAVVLIITTFLVQTKFTSFTPSSLRSYAHSTPQRLHILIPATSANYNLCQLLISAALLGYPAPVLVNWADHEDGDEMKQHITKITGVMKYIQALPEDQKDDLIFMLDGFDTWFQLPMEFIIKKYHEVMAKAHLHHLQIFGAELVKEHNIKNTVLFGPDKRCSPNGPEDPGCWAVPQSWVEKMSFGPLTDSGDSMYDRPRWLNSGTIIGPARDFANISQAALDTVARHHVTDSDQYYFSTVFGTQSYARKQLKLSYDDAHGINDTDLETVPPKKHRLPEMKPGNRTEFYMGLDWESSLFQTAAYYGDYVAWVRFNTTSEYVRKTSQSINPHHHFTLPNNMAGSGPMSVSEARQIDPALASWSRLPLAVNTVTRHVPVIIHINGKKGYRYLWWPRNWFYPYMDQMLHRQRQRGLRNSGEQRDALAGAWTFSNGTRGWVEWNDVCAKYENRLMGKHVLNE
ncbi:hypothetical protein B0A52_03893 [Exophiala mesophila]|uniref:Uncharacterized protein n=1 Tax=Exophiala mesophila TaxID=212818 RepID=A0A438N7U9_EXOME|nr:hypothetical protein B0A52_03893 [Exophiala mesophila]